MDGIVQFAELWDASRNFFPGLQRSLMVARMSIVNHVETMG